MKRYIVASTQRKKTTIKLLESLVNSDKVIYMTAAMEKSWVNNVLNLHDPDILHGDRYLKIINVTSDPEVSYSWVIIHTYYIEDGSIVCDTSEDDTLNYEFASDMMPTTVTVMTESEAIDRLNEVIEKQQQARVSNYMSDEEVKEIYDIVNSGKGFIALSPSNKRYLIIQSKDVKSSEQKVRVFKYELLRDLVPRTYKNKAILIDKTWFSNIIDNTCKRDKQGNIFIKGLKLRFNMNNLEVVSEQDVNNILNKIENAVEYYRYYHNGNWSK